MISVSFGPWRGEVSADGHVTLTGEDGEVVHLKYTRDDQGRGVVKEVRVEAGESGHVSGRLWRRIPFPEIERHISVGFTRADKCPTVKAPEGRLTEDFLESVAAAYLWLCQDRHNPAPAIAAMAHAHTRTVHRWVHEARKRGILPPARPGRAG